MKSRFAITAAATLAAGCANPLSLVSAPTLKLSVYGGELQMQQYRGDTTRVLTRQGFDDPNGFAGLEVVIAGDNMATYTFTAADFARVQEPEFRVPRNGQAMVTARIVQDGRTVAEVSESWELASRIQWTIDVERTPWPAGNGIPENLDHPECMWFWCHKVWRSAIAEDVANYPDEALWVTLYRYRPGECADVC
ncbi:MAG: hypothetical protein F4059_06360 [Gemmatimonadetes bacterium]|nr:hypothetical protein [Gemmatimonadota bacterium]